MAEELNLPNVIEVLELLLADSDDVTYTALDEATKNGRSSNCIC